MEQTREKTGDDHVLETPLYITIIRGFQVLVSLIILALCARLMHDAYLDEEGLSLAISLLTWLAVAYIVLTEKIPGLRGGYHIVAVLVVDGVLVILWLAAFAATAARRSKFKFDVNVGNCFDDGSLVDSKTCDVFKRDAELLKRDVVMFKSGLAMLSAVAGLGALVWLLFIATFVWTIIMFVRGRKEGRFAMSSGTATPSNNYQLESKITEAQPMAPQPQQFQQQQQPAPYQQAPSPFQQPQSPYQQQTAELDGQSTFTTPPPAATSPPPQQFQQQPYPAQAYPQQQN
ncbi:hypothetical protein ACJZ2D_005935 [Fusarium nematophilum]